jgi:aspartate 4-decarboxylase
MTTQSDGTGSDTTAEPLALPLQLRARPDLAELSPFELKGHLAELAGHHDRPLDAGRGNPNWIATNPREAFFALGSFALDESYRCGHEPGLSEGPQRPGIAARFDGWVRQNLGQRGVESLGRCVDVGLKAGFDPDAWIHELVDGVIGDHYPTPDRIAPHVEQVVGRYLTRELCAGEELSSPLHLFATEGGSAAMCYLFDSLNINGVLPTGAKVALMVPAFTPYLEIPRLPRFGFEIVEVVADGRDADGNHTWQFSDDELQKLADPDVAALFVINPSNPPSVMLSEHTLGRLAAIVAEHNPTLVIVTDDVYATFVDGFRSIVTVLPANTIVVYSFSKLFGATGWRLGVVGMGDDHVVDRIIAGHSAGLRSALRERYETITHDASHLRFIDRMVADSRLVALNHTAGLSGPQQVQMVLFAATELADELDSYEDRCREMLARRLRRLYDALGIELDPDQFRAGYYVELDLAAWSRHRYGAELADRLVAESDSAGLVCDLARHAGIVVLDGEGFGSDGLSIRISLANLRDDDYADLGARLVERFDAYRMAWFGVAGPGGGTGPAEYGSRQQPHDEEST